MNFKENLKATIPRTDEITYFALLIAGGNAIAGTIGATAMLAYCTVGKTFDFGECEQRKYYMAQEHAFSQPIDITVINLLNTGKNKINKFADVLGNKIPERYN